MPKETSILGLSPTPADKQKKVEGAPGSEKTIQEKVTERKNRIKQFKEKMAPMMDKTSERYLKLKGQLATEEYMLKKLERELGGGHGKKAKDFLKKSLSALKIGKSKRTDPATRINLMPKPEQPEMDPERIFQEPPEMTVPLEKSDFKLFAKENMAQPEQPKRTGPASQMLQNLKAGMNREVLKVKIPKSQLGAHLQAMRTPSDIDMSGNEISGYELPKIKGKGVEIVKKSAKVLKSGFDMLGEGFSRGKNPERNIDFDAAQIYETQQKTEDPKEIKKPSPSSTKIEATTTPISTPEIKKSDAAPVMITQRMRTQLMQKGYKKAEIDSLTPVQAAEIINQPETKPAQNTAKEIPTTAAVIHPEATKTAEEIAPSPVVAETSTAEAAKPSTPEESEKNRKKALAEIFSIPRINGFLEHYSGLLNSDNPEEKKEAEMELAEMSASPLEYNLKAYRYFEEKLKKKPRSKIFKQKLKIAQELMDQIDAINKKYNIEDEASPDNVHHPVQTAEPAQEADLAGAAVINTEEEKEAIKEVEKMTKKERLTFSQGLNMLGHKVEEGKYRLFAGALGLAKNEKGYFGQLRKIFTRNANDAAKRAIAEKDGGLRSKMASASKLGSFIFRYGRVASDFSGYTLVSPTRWVMAGTMALKTGLEAGKEKRLASDAVRSQTWIHDVEQAQAEAYAFYEAAKKQSGSGNVTRDDLQKAFVATVPADLKRKLANPNFSNDFIQKNIKSKIEKAVTSLESKISVIRSSSKPEEVKKKEEDALMKKWENLLMDYDRMVTEFGTINELAYNLQRTERLSEGLVQAMTIETFLLSADKVLEKFFDTNIGVDELEGKVIGKINNALSGVSEKISGSFNTQMYGLSEQARIKVNDWLKEPVSEFKITTESPTAKLPTAPNSTSSILDPETANRFGLKPTLGYPQNEGPSYLKTIEEANKERFANLKMGSADILTASADNAPVAETTFTGGKGGLQGWIDFKADLKAKFPDTSKLPQEIQDMLKASSKEDVIAQAKAFGFYDPGAAAESAEIVEGSTLRYENGKIIFHDARTGLDVDKYDGPKFDSDKPDTEVAAVESTTPKSDSLKYDQNLTYNKSPEEVTTEIFQSQDMGADRIADELREKIANTIDQANIPDEDVKTGLDTEQGSAKASDSTGESWTGTKGDRIYYDNLKEIFPEKAGPMSMDRWNEYYAKRSAGSFFNAEAIAAANRDPESAYGRLIRYANELKRLSGTSPRGGIFGIGKENIANYMQRALKVLESNDIFIKKP